MNPNTKGYVQDTRDFAPNEEFKREQKQMQPTDTERQEQSTYKAMDPFYPLSQQEMMNIFWEKERNMSS